VSEIRQYVKVPAWHTKQFRQWKKYPDFANKKEEGNKKRKAENEEGQKKKSTNSFNNKNKTKHAKKSGG
jgi:hypothetical protein